MKYDKTFFWKNSHSYHRLTYHLVFTPKYRRRVLQGKLALRLKQLFFECAEVNSWFIHEIEIMPDHVHIFAQIPPTLAVARVSGDLQESRAAIGALALAAYASYAINATQFVLKLRAARLQHEQQTFGAGSLAEASK